MRKLMISAEGAEHSYSASQLAQRGHDFQNQMGGRAPRFTPPQLPYPPPPRGTAFDTGQLTAQRSAAAAPRGKMVHVMFTIATNYDGKVTVAESPGPSGATRPSDAKLEGRALPQCYYVCF